MLGATVEFPDEFAVPKLGGELVIGVAVGEPPGGLKELAGGGGIGGDDGGAASGGASCGPGGNVSGAGGGGGVPSEWNG
ncbi:MAG: hypothetical protein KDA75_03300 [Planctomycetaceae bacterium]|nr:hypothetical protein [Planctomycetaceae bacterium]